jgi:broad specificity phosphatase PhoE
VRLLLIRHGQTPANVRGALDTAFPGLGLTALGEAQAAAVPDALADEHLTAVYASPLVRTQLTAAPLAAARGLTAEVRPGLEEVSAGALEMREDPEAIQGYVDALAAWMSGDLDHTMPGGPDGHAFWRRYDDAIGALAARHAGETVAVFSHGAAIRVWSAIATQMSVERAAELSIANTGMATLEGDPASGWRLERWHGDPLGGHDLLDVSAQDVTGENAEDATGS